MESTTIRKSGLRISRPRCWVLKTLKGSAGVPRSASQIHLSLAYDGHVVELATVHKVLRDFVAVGLVNKRTFDGKCALFGINMDRHWDYMVCSRCSEVTGFCCDEYDDHLHQLTGQMSFTMVDYALTMYGLCKGCTADG